MMKTQAYTTIGISLRMHVRSLTYFAFFVLLITFLSVIRSYAQEEPEYYEIAVFLDVPLVGGGEIDAVIKGEDVYLPVTDLFNFLKIKNVPSPDLEIITGFFINPEGTYRIDRGKNLIEYGGELFRLNPGDLVRTETNLYLKAYYFGHVFGLDCAFDFRNLSVTINAQLELPLIREMRLEEMRRNLTLLKGEEQADTTIGRTYPMFHFGNADWSAIATEQINGPAEARLNLTLGSILFGGETTVSLNYNSREPFTEKQQYYLWRYVNNDNKALRQVMAGKIATRATSTIYDPVVGVQVTNAPTTFRRSFGSYTLSDKTEPGWIVELYVNNVLVDYVVADPAGFYSFEVPLVYGSSRVRLKFYGPWGEERTSERNISIPFNFIPKNTLEYNVSAGMVEDTLHSRFSRASVNYGLSKNVTIGAGYEYLSSVSSGALMPYVKGSFRIFSNLLLSGEYTYSVRGRGTLSYRLPSNIQFDLSYIKYAKGQTAINYNYLEERRASVSLPIRLKKFSAYTRLTVNQLILPASNYTTGEWLISGSLFGVSANLTTYATFIGNTTPNVYSNLSLSFRLPANFTITPQAQYTFTDNEFLTAKIRLEKRLLRNGYLTLSYEQNFVNNLNIAELGFRYDFKFAQTGFSSRRTNRSTILVQYARGSLINDRKTNYLGTDNRANVGRGGISIIPFLDVNANGRRDSGEPKAYGLNLRANGGRIERSEKDTIIRILNLEPYTECMIELDQSSFDNIAWRMKNTTLSVAVDPNKLKLVEIPVSIVGEASGMVMIDKDGRIEGLARLIVNFYDENQKQIGRTLSEEDGYFSYFGFDPGNYTASIDTAQLNKLEMIVSPTSISFDIDASIEGDYVDDLEFIIEMKPVEEPVAPEGSVGRKDTTYVVIHEIYQEVTTSSTDSYIIQLGAFKRKSNANAYRKKLAAMLGVDVEIIVENGFYKVRILGFETREEVDKFIAILAKNGITELWVITLKGMKKQWVLTTVQDTITESIEAANMRKSGALPPSIFLEVGAFKDSTRAEVLRSKVDKVVDRPVVIVEENGYYKVRVVGFSSTEQRELLIPFLSMKGIDDLWLIPEESKQAPVSTVAREWQLGDTISEIKPIFDSDIPDKELKMAIYVEPKFSLQVAVFNKISKAEKAQKKIIDNLNLPVKIVQEFDYYRVVVTGFYTREETYKYYPQLTELGFPAIYFIEDK